ncbi:hypothetical protein [Dactylosporangium sp. CA-233914]|uniref:hypothetical protein n=1 Tax=Dactylosporangium sp. CA-233914 TaxID=3239934 RepID=UPI003D8A1BB7
MRLFSREYGTGGPRFVLLHGTAVGVGLRGHGRSGHLGDATSTPRPVEGRLEPARAVP